ncbi:MAG: hypothetical protein ASARMPREDX12_005884 [Alectoria sarmentosa]|nr:MAG: hypothetical protein ASARMPREDX12_005884 [Alectoria sarmentosa]
MRATIPLLTSLLYLMIPIFAVVPPVHAVALSANMLSNSLSITSGGNLWLDFKLSASFLNASNPTIVCFDTIRGVKSINMANYFEAVQQVLIRDDAIVPRQFNLGPTRDRQFNWLGGPTGDKHEAVIVLSYTEPLLTALFPIILVAHVAALIANECITEAKGYAGGWASLGPTRGSVGVGNVRSNP